MAGKNTDLLKSLIGYVNDIKPYHTKLKEFISELVLSDNFSGENPSLLSSVNVSISEQVNFEVTFKGIWTRDDRGGYYLESIFDGTTNGTTFKIPVTIFPRFSINDSLNYGQTPLGDDPADTSLVDSNLDGFPDIDVPYKYPDVLALKGPQFSYSHQQGLDQIPVSIPVINVVRTVTSTTVNGSTYNYTYTLAFSIDKTTVATFGLDLFKIKIFIDSIEYLGSVTRAGDNFTILGLTDTFNLTPFDLDFLPTLNAPTTNLAYAQYGEDKRYRKITVFSQDTGRYRVSYNEGTRVYVNNELKVYGDEYIVGDRRDYVQFLDGKGVTTNTTYTAFNVNHSTNLVVLTEAGRRVSIPVDAGKRDFSITQNKHLKSKLVYFEALVNAITGNEIEIGLVNPLMNYYRERGLSTDIKAGGGTNSYAVWSANGSFTLAQPTVPIITSSVGIEPFIAGDRLMFAWNLVTGKGWIGKNGGWFNYGNPVTGANPQFHDLATISMAVVIQRSGSSSCDISFNFGQAAFAYTVPTGFEKGITNPSFATDVGRYWMIKNIQATNISKDFINLAETRALKGANSYGAQTFVPYLKKGNNSGGSLIDSLFDSWTTWNKTDIPFSTFFIKIDCGENGGAEMDNIVLGAPGTVNFSGADTFPTNLDIWRSDDDISYGKVDSFTVAFPGVYNYAYLPITSTVYTDSTPNGDIVNSFELNSGLSSSQSGAPVVNPVGSSHPRATDKIDINQMKVDKLFISYLDPFDFNVDRSYDNYGYDLPAYDTDLSVVAQSSVTDGAVDGNDVDSFEVNSGIDVLYFGASSTRSDNFTLTIDHTLLSGYSSLIFENQIPGTTKAKMKILNIYPATTATGDIWLITATSYWTFSVQKIYPALGPVEAAFFKTTFDNGKISFIIDKAWSDYTITLDPDSYLTKGLPVLPDLTEYQVNLNLVTEHGVVISPNPVGIINPNPDFEAPIKIIPFGKISKKTVNNSDYIFKLLETPKRGTYVELRVEQNNQFNQTTAVGIDDLVKIKVLYLYNPVPPSTNTYATWNPSDKAAKLTLSGANLIATHTGDNTSPWDASVRSTISVSSGKWYWEIKPTITASAGDMSFWVGVGNSQALLTGFAGALNSVGYNGLNGWIYANGIIVTGSSAATYGVNDVIGVALNTITSQVWFYKNGVLQSIINLGLNGIFGPYFAMTHLAAMNDSDVANFGATAFAYPVPTGYNAGLYTGGAISNTANLTGVQSTFNDGTLLTQANSQTYATWDTTPSAFLNMSFSGGNLVATHITTNGSFARSNLFKSSGKWYWEFRITNDVSPPDISVGYGNISYMFSYVGGSVNSVGYDDAGIFVYNAIADPAAPATWTTGAIIGVALDVDGQSVTFYKNGVLQGTATHVVTKPYYAAISSFYTGGIITANFGSTAFSYSVPTGYNAGLYVSYNTMNPLDMTDYPTYTYGLSLDSTKLIVTKHGAGNADVRSLLSVPSGKWYWEAKMTALTSGGVNIGIGNAAFDTPSISYVPSSHPITFPVGLDNAGNSVGYGGVFGQIQYQGLTWGANTPLGTGDVVGMALDADAKLVSFYVNGVFQATRAFNTTVGPYYAIVNLAYQNDVVTFNFGQSAFTYPVPTGFNAGFYN